MKMFYNVGVNLSLLEIYMRYIREERNGNLTFFSLFLQLFSKREDKTIVKMNANTLILALA